MKRNNWNLPDAVNCRINDNFTQVPNNILRNPNLTAKAKIILFILFSNKEGWHSYAKTIQLMMTERMNALQSGLKELEENGYLRRIKYREKKTKVWKGSFWAYTDIPNKFDIQKHLKMLDKKGFEPEPGFPDMDYPDVDEPDMENPDLIILNNNNTNLKNTKTSSTLLKKNGFITPKQFDLFWKMYPRKAYKGGAYTSWMQICHRKKNRPTWRQIREALYEQSESKQWKKSIKFIPLPTTWLNESRWMDDAEEMIDYDKDNPEINNEQELADKFRKA